MSARPFGFSRTLRVRLGHVATSLGLVAIILILAEHGRVELDGIVAWAVFFLTIWLAMALWELILYVVEMIVQLRRESGPGGGGA